MQINIEGIQGRLPTVMLDDKVYFITGGTYQKLHNEKQIQERYDRDGNIDRQMISTYCHRWQMTLYVPSSYANVSLSPDAPFSQSDVGDLDTLHTTADKLPPNDLLTFWDITCLDNFSGTYTHYVYLSLDWESPVNDDPGKWQIPVKLWGYNS